jgi:superfamily II DNA or RNA helicase
VTSPPSPSSSPPAERPATLPRLSFDRGTLLFEGFEPALAQELPGVIWDPRVALFRAPACRYDEVHAALVRDGIPFDDRVSAAATAAASAAVTRADWLPIDLRPYQQAALTAWELAGRRGTVVMPTGSGKTRVALGALAQLGAPALCLVPTRVLLWQWIDALRLAYRGAVGCWGDGQHQRETITVCTFEGALRHASRWGAAFQAVIVDEAHHFGAGAHDEALEMLTAGARLGLTATPPAEAAQAARLSELLGPVVYRLGIDDLAGTYLAHYDVIIIEVHLDAEERRRHEQELEAFRKFHRAFRRVAPEAGWSDLVRVAQRSEAGRRALAARRMSQRIQAFPRAKQRQLSELIARHRCSKVLVFTPNNETAYAVAREHLLMPLTCDIGRAEREAALEAFRSGALRALVSSRVLNEGLDVPDADVAIILGGALGTREHVQRIGRLLRPRPGKRAIVYELVTAGTSEVRLAAKRRKGLLAQVEPVRAE